MSTKIDPNNPKTLPPLNERVLVMPRSDAPNISCRWIIATLRKFDGELFFDSLERERLQKVADVECWSDLPAQEEGLEPDLDGYDVQEVLRRLESSAVLTARALDKPIEETYGGELLLRWHKLMDRLGITRFGAHDTKVILSVIKEPQP